MSEQTATDLARTVVQALVTAGVTEVVVSPGSRNAPLAFAAYDAAQAGVVRLHTRVDERSAGFLALGLTRSHARAAVVCTSGTAVANLHPAALEAAHAGLPLVVVTADRPARLRGTGANQTTDQVGVLGRLVPSVDLDSPHALDLAGVLDAEGPVHLNVQLDDPLLPDAGAGPWLPEVLADWSTGWNPADRPDRSDRSDRPDRPDRPDRSDRSDRGDRVDAVELPLGPRTVVVAGDDAGQAARRLAEAAGWPLLAEPTSGSRTGDRALRCYRLLLGADDGPGRELADAVERVVVLGRPTLSRPVTRLLARGDVEVCSVPARGVWAERPFPVAQQAPAYRVVGVDTAHGAWTAAWHEADRAIGRRLDALLAGEPGLTPHEVAGLVSAAVEPSMQLVVGASNPIRDLDLMARPYRVGERRKVVANRGLSGIDGVVSTAVGAALGRDEGPSLALLGDVTFLHDGNGLVLGPDEPRPDLTIVVVNDDGGSIFATLEQGAPAYGDRFERLFGTPHGVDLEALCAATRTPHLRVESRPALEHALATTVGEGSGIQVVEARVGRSGTSDRRDLEARIRALRP